MIPVEWDPALDTGDALIDEQHRDIVALMNEVSALESDDVAAILSVVDRLVVHVDTHFRTEEDLMVRTGYPSAAIEEHKREHRMLKDKARGASFAFRGAWNVTREPFVDFLRTWLLDHIENEDRKLVAHLRHREAVDPIQQ